MSYILLCFLLAINYVESTYTFMSMGDWGASTVTESTYPDNAAEVANAMNTWAKNNQPRFVINTGDNFYWCGIQNTSDFQVEVDFIDTYSYPSLKIPWYGSLGNHEYGYNVTAQLSLKEERDDMYNWILPDRYYYKRIPLPLLTTDSSSRSYISLVVLDTSPCVQDFRNTDVSEWDPCGTEYPTCSIEATDDDFEGTCMFHENILSQNCTLQYEWFEDTMKTITSTTPDDWIVVVGHAPADEMDVEDFVGVMQVYGMDLYLNGHVHAMQQYTVDGYGAYFTTGAGSMAETTPDSIESADQLTTIMKARKDGGISGSGKRVHEAKIEHQKNQLEKGQKMGEYYSSHSYSCLFDQKINGFTVHSFNDDYTTLTTQIISSKDSSVLLEYTQTKGQFKNYTPSGSDDTTTTDDTGVHNNGHHNHHDHQHDGDNN